MENLRVRMMGVDTVAASAVRYDAECNREAAASICASARRERERSQALRDENRAVRAQADLAVRRSRRLVSAR